MVYTSANTLTLSNHMFKNIRLYIYVSSVRGFLFCVIYYINFRIVWFCRRSTNMIIMIIDCIVSVRDSSNSLFHLHMYAFVDFCRAYLASGYQRIMHLYRLRFRSV